MVNINGLVIVLKRRLRILAHIHAHARTQKYTHLIAWMCIYRVGVPLRCKSQLYIHIEHIHNIYHVTHVQHTYEYIWIYYNINLTENNLSNWIMKLNKNGFYLMNRIRFGKNRFHRPNIIRNRKTKLKSICFTYFRLTRFNKMNL